MRRKVLLVLLWLAGTAVATGVVFQAVILMTNTFREAGQDSGVIAAGKRTAAATTTTLPAVPSVASATAVTAATPAVPTTTSPVTSVELATTTTNEVPPDETGQPGVSATGSATSTGTRTTVPVVTPTTSRTTPPPVATTAPPTVTPAPTAPSPTEPPPPPPPTTPPPPPPPTTSGASCSPFSWRRYAAGPNSFSVKLCPDDTVRFFPGSAKVAVGYSVTVNQPGPPSVEITFSGTDSQGRPFARYHCVVSIQDSLTNVCD